MLSGFFDSSFNHRVALVNLSQRIQHFWQFGGVDWFTCNLHHRNCVVFEWAKKGILDSGDFLKILPENFSLLTVIGKADNSSGFGDWLIDALNQDHATGSNTLNFDRVPCLKAKVSKNQIGVIRSLMPLNLLHS